MKYYCLRCGLDFKQKCHLENHLNRKNICAPILEPMSMEEVKKRYGFEKNENKNKKVTPNDPKMPPNESKMNPNESKMDFLKNEKLNPNESKMDSVVNPNESKMDSSKLFKCSCCGKCYSTNSNMRKHEKKCKGSNSLELEELKKNYSKLEETLKNQQTMFDNTIKEILLKQDNSSVNNSHNSLNNSHNNINSNNTDNSTHIHINNYGCENKDYITKDYLLKLLKAPFQAIPKLIEYTHFNKEHPENQNIKLPNKKQPYVKVLKDDKWVYADRKSTILDLIDEKHSELNGQPLIKHIEEKFSDGLQDRFERFNERYLNDEKDFTKQLYKETELVMINNS